VYYILYFQFTNNRQPIILSCVLVHEGFKTGTASKAYFAKQSGLLLAKCLHLFGVCGWDLQLHGFVLIGRCQ
jgi:hypothetical protein